MVTRCHWGPCPLPSPGDELLSSSSHRTLGCSEWTPCRANISPGQAAQGGPGPESAETRGPGADSDIVLELGWPGPPSTSREWDFSQEEEGTGETAAWIPDRYWWQGLLWHLWSSIDLSSARYWAQIIRPAPVRRRGPYQMQSINLQN